MLNIALIVKRNKASHILGIMHIVHAIFRLLWIGVGQFNMLIWFK